MDLKKHGTASHLQKAIELELKGLENREVGLSKLFPKRLRVNLKDFYSKLFSRNDIPGEYRRIYHYHTKKTGGTSLNFSLLSLSRIDPLKLYAILINAFDHRHVANGKVFVGWNKNLIEDGNFFYGWSHIAAHNLKLKPETFTITIIRNPCERVISVYKHLLREKRRGEIKFPKIKEEVSWLGFSFDDFLENIPREHLQRQLYMFSENFDVEEAFENIKGLSCFFFLDNYRNGVRELSKALGCKLKPFHLRKSSPIEEISDKQKKVLKERLAPEMFLYEKLRKHKGY